VAPAALGPISLNTYDAWPALLTVLALWLLLRDRDLLAFGTLGLAVTSKVYPLALVPLACIYAWRRAGPRRTVAALCVFAVVAALVVIPFAAYDAHGVSSSFRSQAERGLQVESLGASVLLAADRLGVYDAKVVETTSVAGRNLSGSLPDALSTASLVLEALAVALVWVLYARARDERARLPLAFGSRCGPARVHEGLLAPVPRLARAARGDRGQLSGDRADRRLAPARTGLVLPLPRALQDRVADLAPGCARRARGRDLRRPRRRACARSAASVEDQDPVALEDEPPVGIAPQPGQLDGGRQRRQPIRVAG